METGQEVKLILDIEPMGAVRTTTSQKFVDKKYAKYKKWKETLVILMFAEMLKQKINPHTAKFSVIKSITFYMEVPMPANLSKKVREEREARLGQPHKMKPDIDNMLKAFMDAFMKEDSHVHEIGCMKKVWSKHSYIELVLVLDC